MGGSHRTRWQRPALINNLYLGQVYLLMVAFMLYGLDSIRKRKTIITGHMLRAVAAIRVFPARHVT